MRPIIVKEAIHTITREQLKEATENAIGATNRTLSAVNIDRVRATVEKMPVVSAGVVWWDPDKKVGCIVGATLQGLPEMGSAYEQLGIYFVSAIRDVLGREQRLDWYLTVVD